MTSFLLTIFVLNLCVLIPTSQKVTIGQDSFGNKKVETKIKRKFIVELAVDLATDCDSSIPDNASSNLLEELNEVKEDWHHEVQTTIKFEGYYVLMAHQAYKESLFRLIVDDRLFPPPEQV